MNSENTKIDGYGEDKLANGRVPDPDVSNVTGNGKL